ncbi:hypothetical protein EPN90_01045 [Patescibacteria group bacterium]|nr:MAG: hypothetical protein EPN90_01045 [Patescibacteria group bacterium]
MESIIALKELRENLPMYEKKVRSGQSFLVMKRSKPIFKISPVDEGDWETVIDFSKLRKGGIDVRELLRRLK